MPGESQRGHGARGCTELVPGKAGRRGTKHIPREEHWWVGHWAGTGREGGQEQVLLWGDFVQGCLMQSYAEVRRAVGGVRQGVVELVSLGLLRGLRALQYSSA